MWEEIRMNSKFKVLCNRILMLVVLILPIQLSVQAVINSTPNINDKVINDIVENEIASDEIVPRNKITVETKDGVITLTGVVSNILAKERPVKIAETVKGVKAIVNRIKVVPSLLVTDKTIKENIELALYSDPAADNYEVSVNVQDGKVFFLGEVESWQEKILCENIAKGIAGVKEVDNKINVNYYADRLDSEIEFDIEKSLSWNVFVDKPSIHVDVNEGVAKLTGVVGSLAEKREATYSSYVTGVSYVDNVDLVVNAFVKDKNKRYSKSEITVREDQEVQKAVQKALLLDPRVKAFNVFVESNDGNVYLRGVVDNLKAKRAAAQDAKNTIGVIDVYNHLILKPELNIDDETLADNVEKIIRNNPLLQEYNISVKSVNGVVQLTGEVENNYEKAIADDIASRVNGAVYVKNKIKSAHPLKVTYLGPYVHGWNLYDYDWYIPEPAYTVKTDAKIKTDIGNEFFWSPFINPNNIKVKVEEGVVTLSGEVSSNAEKEAVLENAFEGGAVWVVNDLRVNYAS